MSWVVFRDGQICPTVMPCASQQEANDAAIVLARYDQAAYTVGQQVYIVAPADNAVAVHRVATGRMVQRETFAPGEGVKGAT